jgi:hypothetical protein
MPNILPEDFLSTSEARESLARIEGLIERVKEAAASPNNKGRGQRHPNVSFGIEEPMTWVRLWNLDTPRYYSDPLYYVEMTLRQKLWRWDYFPEDNVPMTLDLPASLSMYPEYTFIGMDLYFSPEGIPTIQTNHPLSRDPNLGLLKPVDFMTSGWMPRALRWWDDIHRIVAGRLNVTNAMTWWRGALDLAMQIRSYDRLIEDVFERPQFVHDLLDFITEQRCRWWGAYSEHFGLKLKPTDIGDDWLNVPFISPGFFRDFVLPGYLRLEAFHGGVNSIHSCGNQAPLQRYLLEIKSLPNFEVSPWTSLEKSLVNIPSEKRLMIGMHPNDVLFSTPEQMEERLRGIASACVGRNYDIGTSGLTPILDTHEAFIRQVNTWTGIVRRVFGWSSSS